MKYDWILFDADGTLFDFAAAEKAALRQTSPCIACLSMTRQQPNTSTSTTPHGRHWSAATFPPLISTAIVSPACLRRLASRMIRSDLVAITWGSWPHAPN